MADQGRGSAEVAAPAGTGNAPGLGEAFALDLNTGQGGYSVPLPLPDGVAGFSPTLKLEYHHGGGPGPFGLGWALPMRTIATRLDYGIPGSIAPVYCDGDRELVPLAGDEYRAARESDFTRYVRAGDGWQVTERTGIVHRLGTGPSTRIADPDHPDRVLAALLAESVDTCGNTISYDWEIDDATAYLATVRYAIYTVRLLYADRPDVRTSGRAGVAQVLSRRCTAIELHVADPAAAGTDTVVRRWALTYRQAGIGGASLLAQVQLTSVGHGVPDVVRPPQVFGYREPDPAAWHAQFVTGVDGGSPPPLTDPRVVLAPLGDGPATGVLQVAGGRFTYWPPAGDGSFAAPRRLDQAPMIADLRSDRVQFMDMDGDAELDMVVGGRTGSAPAGFYRGDGRGGLAEFVAYPATRRSGPLNGSAPARLGDLDGDGRIDVLTAAGRGLLWWRNDGADGWDDPQPVRLAADDAFGAPPPDLGDPLVRMADMTGDGLPDLVRIRPGYVQYWPNLGLGRFGPPVVMAAAPRLPAGDPRSLLLIDVDGDGCADLVRVDGAGVSVWPNLSGTAFGDPIHDPLVPTPIPGTVSAAATTDDAAVGLLWCSHRSGGTGYVRYTFGPPAYQLTSVDNGAGLHSAIEYTTAAAEQRRDMAAGRSWTRPLPFPLVVVASTREQDAVTGQVAESGYRYHDAYYDDRTRTFCGFAEVEKVETGDASRPDGRTVFFFRIGEDRLPGNGPEQAALNRMLRRVEVYADDATPGDIASAGLAALPYTVEESQHAVTVLGTGVDGRQRVWATVTGTTRSIAERGDDVRTEQHAYTYDAFGNVIRDEQRCAGNRGGAAQPELAMVTDIDYATDAARNMLDRVSRITRRDGSGVLLQELHRHYDGDDFTGLPLGGIERGLLSRETRWVLTKADADAHYGTMDVGALGYQADTDADGRPGLFAPVERNRYDAAGRKAGFLSPTGSPTSIGYDSTGLFRAQQTNTLGVTATEFDVPTGKPTRIAGSDGVTITVRHDAQGRLLDLVLPGDTGQRPTRSYAYDDTAMPNAVTVTMRLASGTDDVGITRVYFDGRSAEVQRRVQLDADRFVVSGQIVRNPWGDPAVEYLPAFADDPGYAAPDPTGQPARRIHYDVLGRPVRTVDYGGGVSTVTYQPFLATTADPNDNDDSPQAAPRGQVGTVREDHLNAAGHRVLTVEHGGSGPVRTAFTPDVLGRFVAHGDDAGQVQQSTFDALGNRLTTTHREAGTRKLFYDAGNRVVRTIDGAGNDVAATFDAADRITTLRTGGTVRETYAYDDAASGGLGKLHSVSYPGGSQTFGYDEAGRRATHTFAFDGVTEQYTFGFDYDPQGRRTSVRYPDGSTVTTALYANGIPRAVPGFAEAIDYDPRLLLKQITFTNRVVTAVDYTPGIGRVAHQRTTGPGGVVLDEHGYGYDPMWRLLSATAVSGGSTATTTYDYDPLYQLTAVHDDPGGGAPVITTPYSYTADRHLSGNGESGLAMHYDDAAHPGRPSRITGPSTDVPVGYDGNGAMTALPGRTLSFGSKGELASVRRDDGTVIDYTYDHTGARIRKQVTASAGPGAVDTLFLGAFGEVRNGQLARYVVVGSSRIAVVHGGVTNWIHTDPLGSATFYTDAAGTRIAAIAYRAFGNAGGEPGTPWAQVFALHEFDSDAGLYYMGRRWYAADLGCFVSPDAIYLMRPERGVDTPAALALYAYAGNDPANNVDPDGGSFWSVVGGIVGVVAGVVAGALVIAALATGVGWAILAIAGVVALVTGGYLLASANQGNGFGEFMKGFLIGFNAGMNFSLAVFTGFVFGVAAVGFGVGLAVGILGFLATFDTVRQNSVYQGILGWSNWLMPMSWLVLGLGAAFFVLNVLGWLFTAGQVDALKISYVHMDWSTGAIVMKGGWISNLNAYHTAFDMGNFVFVDRQNTSPDDDVPHETGHNLSLGAFGSVVHLVGFVDEFFFGGGTAWTEKMADSHAGKGSDTTWNH